jgi:hypothetical protein
VSRPVTPTRGSKRMTCDTPAPVRNDAARGNRYWTAPTQVMTAIAALEARLNAKFAALAMTGEATERRIGTLAQARQAKETWDFEQWEKFAAKMNARRREIEGVREQMSSLAQQIQKQWVTAPEVVPVPRQVSRRLSAGLVMRETECGCKGRNEDPGRRIEDQGRECSLLKRVVLAGVDGILIRSRRPSLFLFLFLFLSSSCNNLFHHSAPQQIALQHNTSSPRPSEPLVAVGPISTFLYCGRALDSHLSFPSSRFASTRTGNPYDNRGHGVDPEKSASAHVNTSWLQLDPGSFWSATNHHHPRVASSGLIPPPAPRLFGGRRLRLAQSPHLPGGCTLRRTLPPSPPPRGRVIRHPRPPTRFICFAF